MACALAAAPSHRCGLASARRAGARRAGGAARPSPMVSLRRPGADLMVARVFSSGEPAAALPPPRRRWARRSPRAPLRPADDEKEQPKLTREKEPEE